MGAEAIQKLLAEIDLDKLSKELREELEHANGQKRVRLLKRLEVRRGFRREQPAPRVDDHGRSSPSFRRICAPCCSWTAAALRPPT